MENNEPTISTDEAGKRVEATTAPRVTVDSIKGRIASATYSRIGTMTLCVIAMRNGFKVIGKSAPADERNFNAEVGERYAYDDAFKQLWPLEGYLLCERLRPAA